MYTVDTEILFHCVAYHGMFSLDLIGQEQAKIAADLQ
jgi:hypothetical protein